MNEQFRSTSTVSTKRVVFNIRDDDFRLVTAVDLLVGSVASNRRLTARGNGKSSAATL